jgi:hypothetical protein
MSLRHAWILSPITRGIRVECVEYPANTSRYCRRFNVDAVRSTCLVITVSSDFALWDQLRSVTFSPIWCNGYHTALSSERAQQRSWFDSGYGRNFLFLDFTPARHDSCSAFFFTLLSRSAKSTPLPPVFLASGPPPKDSK